MIRFFCNLDLFEVGGGGGVLLQINRLNNDLDAVCSSSISSS